MKKIIEDVIFYLICIALFILAIYSLLYGGTEGAWL